jgi:HTH-type transcriptional regulator, competence development regulator
MYQSKNSMLPVQNLIRTFFVRRTRVVTFIQNLYFMTVGKKYIPFGIQLRQLREAMGMTLKDVAIHFEMDPSLLGKIERNERQPTKYLIKNVAAYFKVNEKELLEEFLSEQIAYKILDEEADINILKVAEEKFIYIKTMRNE